MGAGLVLNILNKKIGSQCSLFMCFKTLYLYINDTHALLLINVNGYNHLFIETVGRGITYARLPNQLQKRTFSVAIMHH